MKIGQKIKIIRTEAQLSQAQLAASLHVSGQAVSNWEREETYPDVANMIRLSDVYHISLDELLREDCDYHDVLMNKKAERRADGVVNTLLVVIIIGVVIYNYITKPTQHIKPLVWVVMLVLLGRCGCDIYTSFFKSN